MERDKILSVSADAPRFTFRKGEKLRHRTLVETLFSEGKSIYEYPLRLTWRLIDEKRLADSFCDHIPSRIDRVQMLVTVPKKKRKHAVDRVLLRRRIREAYRLNRLPLLQERELDPDKGTLSLAFIYLDNDNKSYAEIESKMKKLLHRLLTVVRKEKNQAKETQDA